MLHLTDVAALAVIARPAPTRQTLGVSREPVTSLGGLVLVAFSSHDFSLLSKYTPQRAKSQGTDVKRVSSPFIVNCEVVFMFFNKLSNLDRQLRLSFGCYLLEIIFFFQNLRSPPALVIFIIFQ